MIINDDIIIDYLNDLSSDKYKNHWVFNNIEQNQYLFEEPSNEHKDSVKVICEEIKSVLNNFTPLNRRLFEELFPSYKEILSKSKVMLVVGCPEPYDAMVMNYKGEDYIVFDLIRFAGYINNGYSLDKLLNQLLTHEFAHKCLMDKYNLSENPTYLEKLNYIMFNEGFAHLLAYKDNIEKYEFKSEDYIERFNKAKIALKDAVKEESPEKQEELLIASDSGPYWDKFASICGKLYLGKNIGSLIGIYEKGWNNIISDILQEE